MKLLLDQGTHRSAAAILREAGYDAVHTGETGLAEAEDSEIIRRAAIEDRVVITRTLISTCFWHWRKPAGRPLSEFASNNYERKSSLAWSKMS